MDYGISDWYAFVERWTPRTVIVDYPVWIARRLAHLHTNPAVLLNMDEVAPDFLRGIPWLSDFLNRVDRAIEMIGRDGYAFVKWDYAYPKDSCAMYNIGKRLPGRMDNVCLVSTATEFLYMSLNSARMYSIVSMDPGALYPVAVREPRDIRYEMRVFIERFKPIAIVQYYKEEEFPQDDVARAIASELLNFALEVAENLPYHSLTLDVGVDMDMKKPILVEVNPPISQGRTDAIWGGWDWKEQIKKDEVLVIHRGKDGKPVKWSIPIKG